MIEIVNGVTRIVPSDAPVDIEQREAELRLMRVLRGSGIEGTIHVEPYTRQQRMLKGLKPAKRQRLSR
jgi:hypothetical protein